MGRREAGRYSQLRCRFCLPRVYQHQADVRQGRRADVLSFRSFLPRQREDHAEAVPRVRDGVRKKKVEQLRSGGLYAQRQRPYPHALHHQFRELRERQTVPQRPETDPRSARTERPDVPAVRVYGDPAQTEGRACQRHASLRIPLRHEGTELEDGATDSDRRRYEVRDRPQTFHRDHEQRGLFCPLGKGSKKHHLHLPERHEVPGRQTERKEIPEGGNGT